MTKGFTDWQEVGIFPLQDHDGNVPIEIRQQLVGGRLTKMHGPENSDDPEEAWVEFGMENEHGTLGDVHPWLFWQTSSKDARGMGSWSMAWGALTSEGGGVSGGGGRGGPVTPGGGRGGGFYNIGGEIYPRDRSGRRRPPRGGGTGTGGRSSGSDEIRVQPFADQYANPDTRYVAKAPGWPKCFSALPQGVEVMVVPGTAESGQAEVMLWADPRLISPYTEGPAECGTLVVDLQPESEPCMDGAEEPGIEGRAARLQTAWKVIPREKTKSGGGIPPTPYVDPVEPPGGRQPGDLVNSGATSPGLKNLGCEDGNFIAWNLSITPLDSLPGFGAVWAKLEGGGGSTSTGQPPKKRTPGNPGDAAQGPCKYGEFKPKPEGKHGVAFVAFKDTWGPITAGHEDDKHRIDRDRDGHPMNSAHISTNALYYRARDEDGPFKFDGKYPETSEFPLWSDVELVWDEDIDHDWVKGPRTGKWRWVAKVPEIQPPTTPPTWEPRDPEPPGRPGRPSTPSRPRPRPPGGPTTPGGGGPGTPSTPRSRPAGPTTPGTNTGFSPPPGSTGGGEPRPGRGQFNLTFPGAGWGGLDEPGGGSGGPRIAQSYTWVGETQTDDVSVYAIHHPFHESFAELSFRPQHWGIGQLDYSRNPHLTPTEYLDEERVRPAVLAMHSWGAQDGPHWNYTTRPHDSRARGGAVSGGVLFAPPHLQMEDFTGGGTAATTTTVTTGYITAAPNVAFALGEPNTDGGLTEASVLIWQDLSDVNRNLKIQQLDSSRATQSLIEAYIDQSTSEILVSIGGTQALAIPRGTTAQRPSSPAGGAIRVNSSGANDVVEYYDVIGAAWTQVGAGGATTFIALTDTPAGYGSSGDVVTSTAAAYQNETPATVGGIGSANKLARLDANGWFDTSMIVYPAYSSVSEGPGSFAGNAGSFVKVNAGETAMEYIAPVQTSAGAGDAGKPIILDAAGHVDATMINDGDIDHGSTGGLADDDHTQYAHITPTSTARNSIKPSSATVVPLRLQATLTHTANLLEIDTAATPAAFVVDKNAKCTSYGYDASSQKITSVANGTATTDACAYGQLDARIVAQAGSFPTPSEGLLCYRTDLDDLFVYDATTTDWLGLGLLQMESARNANAITTAQYLLGGPGNASTQYRSACLPFACKLVFVTHFVGGTVTNTDIIVRRNGSDIVTINRSAPDSGASGPTGTVTTTDNDSFGAGDMAQVYIDPTPGSDSINVPYVTLWFRRVAT